jgi:hypothetical protein
MPILSITTSETGLVSVNPSVIYINTSDTFAQVTTTGYLTLQRQAGFTFNNQQMALVFTTDDGPVWLSIEVVGSVVSLSTPDVPGETVLPTIANHIIVATNTVGTLANLTGTAINNGSIQAGLSGTAGSLISFPLTTAKGSLQLVAVANTGDTVTTLSNVAMGQASVVSIPDPVNAVGRLLIGATAAPFVSGNFPQNSGTGGLMVDSGVAVSSLATTSTAVLLTPAADQIITVHNLTLAQGNLVAGSSGHAGTITSFPATSANGSLVLAAVNAGGAFNMTISNAAIGQSTVISIPDPGAVTAKFLLDSGTQIMAAGSQLNLAKVNGTEAGTTVTASGQAGFITTSSLTVAGGGNYIITWTNTHIVPTSVIALTIQGGTNNSTQNITFTCVAGAGSATLSIYNNTAATALNGTIIIGYAVF